MNHKKILSALMVASFLALGVGYVFSEPLKFGICEPAYYEYYSDKEDKDKWCHSAFDENIPEPLLWSFLPLLFITLTLFFVRREIFLAWAKFAGIAFPLMLGVLLYTHNNIPVSGGWIGGPTDDQLATVFLPPLFAIISLLIIGVKSWKLRKEIREV